MREPLNEELEGERTIGSRTGGKEDHWIKEWKEGGPLDLGLEGDRGRTIGSRTGRRSKEDHWIKDWKEHCTVHKYTHPHSYICMYCIYIQYIDPPLHTFLFDG